MTFGLKLTANTAVSEITFSFLGYLLIVGSARGSRTVVTRSYLGSANVCKKSIYFEFFIVIKSEKYRIVP